MKFLVMLSIVFTSIFAFAQEVVAPVAADDFLLQVLKALHDLGGMAFGAKVAALCLLAIASMKVSVLSPLWEKLGSFKVLAAPILAGIAGLASLSMGADKISLPVVSAWVLSGGGAIIVHEILDAVKTLPMVGEKYVMVIDIMENLLGKKQ